MWKHSYFYPNTTVKVKVYQSSIGNHINFDNIFQLFKPAKQVEALEWFLSTWMKKEQVFVPGFQVIFVFLVWVGF